MWCNQHHTFQRVGEIACTCNFFGEKERNKEKKKKKKLGVLKFELALTLILN